MIRIIATAGAAQLMLMGSVHGAADPAASIPSGGSKAKSGKTTNVIVDSVVKAADVMKQLYNAKTAAYASLSNSVFRHMGDKQGLEDTYKVTIQDDLALDLSEIAGVMVDHFVDEVKSWTAETLKGYPHVKTKIPQDFDEFVLEQADILIQNYGYGGVKQQIQSFDHLLSKFKSDMFAEMKKKCIQTNSSGVVPPRKRASPRQRPRAADPSPKPEPKKQEPELPKQSQELKMLYGCYDFLCVDTEAKNDEEKGAKKALSKIKEQEQFNADPNWCYTVRFGLCEPGTEKMYSSNAQEAAVKVYKDIMKILHIDDDSSSDEE